MGKPRKNCRKMLDNFDVELSHILPAGCDWSDIASLDLKSVTKDKAKEVIDIFDVYRRDPCRFINDELGIGGVPWPDDLPDNSKLVKSGRRDRLALPLWSKQKQILDALVKYKKVAVKSSHASGKSFVAGLSALYLAFAWRALGITTAPTFRQVRRVLWGEIHKLYNSAPRSLGGKLTQTSLELGDKWFIEGFSTKDPTANIAGFHEESVFVIVDEAGGVSNDVFESMEGVLTSKNSFVLLIGNPLDETSHFADIFDGFHFRDGFNYKSGYYCITISAFDIPNVRHQQEVYPQLCAMHWPKAMGDRWGTDSSIYRVKVLGQFPNDASRSLIPLIYLQKALDEWSEPEKTDQVVAIGCDIARFGDDRTVIGLRYESGKFKIYMTTEKERETSTAGRLRALHDDICKNQKRRPVINLDDSPVGGGVQDILWEANYPVNGINSSGKPESYSEHDKENHFQNLRGLYYWKLREHFMNGTVFIEDEELSWELSKIIVDKYSSTGKVLIERKENIKKRLKKSPDLADCAMLAFAEDEEINSGDMIIWL